MCFSIVFSFKHVEKPLVFCFFETNMHLFVKILVRKCKKRKQRAKTIMFYMKHCKKEQFCLIFLCFFIFLTSKSEKATAGEMKKK